MESLLWPTLAASASVVAAAAFWIVFGPTVHARRRMRLLAHATKSFYEERKRLEARFASRPLRAILPEAAICSVDRFTPDVAFAWDKRSWKLRALVGARVRFARDGTESMGDDLQATAVFHLERGRWNTDGRLILNLDPEQVLRHYIYELQKAS